jgi:hypothetical protein
MRPAYTFETTYEISRLERCAVTVRAREPVSVTEVDALMMLRRGFELTDHRPYVVFVDLNDVVEILPGARRVLASARHVLAASMLGSTPVDRMMAAGYAHAAYPAEYFEDRAAAFQWLAVMHDLLCADPVPHTMSLTIDLDPFDRPRFQPTRG